MTGWKEIKFLSTDVPPFPKIRCITIDPLDLGHLFIGTEKGLYVTHDYGGSWHPALESFKIVSILISHFENRHILFAATSGRSKSDGIYQSPDDGKSWEVVHWRTNIVALTQWIPELWSHQKFPAQYFMATYGEGVYQSQDGCRSWREIDNGLTEKRYTSLAVHSSRRGQLYLGTENGLFKYAPILPSIDLRLDDQDLAFWPPQPKDGELVEIYATVHNESPVAVFNVAICFTDNADGMLPVIVPIDTLVIPSIRPYSECTLRAEWSPRGQTGDNLIFVQVDPANQIAELNERNNLASIHIYLDKPLSNRYWVDISRDLPDKWIRDIASHPFNRGEIFIGTNAGAFTAGLMEKHWKQLTFDESSAVKVTRIAAEPHPYLDWTVPVLWLGTEEYSLIPEDRLGRAFRSQDGGEHWRDTRYPGSAVCALAIPAGNSLMAYIASYNPFYSIDEFFICEDTLWTSHDLTPEDTAAYRINCFAFSQEEIDIGTTNGFHIIGKDQHLIDHSLKKLNVVSIIRPIRYRDRAIYAATRGKNLNDGIHRSYDEGKSWEQIASFEDIVSLVAVNHSTEIEAVAPHFYLALYGQGVFESRNGGQFWTDITSNLNEKRITCLAVDRRNPEIVYLGTENGIFYFNDPGATLVRNPEPAVSITRSFRLHQNHPNPFNHATMIPFELPEEAQVDIGIYNTLGQRIKSFPCHHFLKGTQHIVWDGTDDSGNGVNSGLYLCRVKYRNFQAQIKLIYLK